jgi:hypothetical protein
MLYVYMNFFSNKQEKIIPDSNKNDFEKICHNIRNGKTLTQKERDFVFLATDKQKNELLELYNTMVTHYITVINLT